MLDFRLLNLFRLLAVAAHANNLDVLFRQDNLAVLRGFVAGVALSTRKGRVRKFLHQLGLVGLVRVMTLDAVGGSERLSLVRLYQICRGCVVAVKTQGRSRLGQVIIKLNFALLANLVRHMARGATHIERSVPTAILWNV